MNEHLNPSTFIVGQTKAEEKMDKNTFHIIIQKQGKFEHYDITRPVTQEKFSFCCDSKTYDVKPEYVYPKDLNILSRIKNKLLRKKLSNEYYIFYQEGKQLPLTFPKQEDISSSLLWTVINNSTTKGMLSNLMKEKFSFGGFNLTFIVMAVGIIGVGIVALHYFGIINLGF